MLGKVIAARTIGPDKDHLQQVAAPHPMMGPGGWMRGRRMMMRPGEHGPMMGGPGTPPAPAPATPQAVNKACPRGSAPGPRWGRAPPDPPSYPPATPCVFTYSA